MKAVFVGHDEIELAGDYQAPAELERQPELLAYAVHERPDAGQRALELDRGAGVWTAAGALLYYDPRASALAWAADGSLWVAIASFEPSEPGRAGVRHRLEQRDPDSFALARVIPFELPSGGPEWLELSPSGGLAVVTWLDQGEWGYVGIDLRAGVQAGLAARMRPGTRAAPPRILADGSAILACASVGAAWWNLRDHDDPSERPSEGGERRIGWITTHELASGRVRESELVVDLPAGWIPDDPYDSRWYRIVGPELDDLASVAVWLPDGSRERFSLPLTDRLTLARPLARVRKPAG